MKTLYVFLLFITMSTFAEMSDKPDQWYVVTDRVMKSKNTYKVFKIGRAHV